MPFRIFLALLAALGLAGCGGEKKDVKAPEQEDPIEDANEIVPLRIRDVRPTDRGPAESGATLASLTELRYEGPGERKDVSLEMAKFQPGADWRSEQLSAATTDQLRKLLTAGPAGVVAPESSCNVLRPDDQAREEQHGPMIVRKWPQRPNRKMNLTGPPGFERALRELRETFPVGEMEYSIKPTTIDADKGKISLRVRVEIRGPAELGTVRKQVNTKWEALWSDTDPPLLLKLAVIEYEEIALAQDAPLPFVDATRKILGETPSYQAQVLTGIDSWASRLTRIGDFSLTGHHGLAVGDVNGDGREDLFVCDAGSLPNRLYVQEPDGQVRDVSAEAGVDWFEDSRSALLIDLDNDGDQDLVVATIAMIAFAENDGSGKFTLRGGHPGAPYPFSLSAADFDNDGRLDIYACVYSAGDSAAARGFEASSPTPFHDAQNGGRNVLLRNLGGFRFADVTERTGLDQDNTRWSFAAAWEDYDRDGDSDLYVANDFGRNCFYRNDDGHFAQIAAAAGVEDTAAGMSVAWGDYDRDGHADLYVGNMDSTAGKRITAQETFADAGSEPVIEKLQRMASGNSLFKSDGEGRFDVLRGPGAHLGGWAWSSGFADINNDGWQDVAVANGYLTGRKPDDL